MGKNMYEIKFVDSDNIVKIANVRGSSLDIVLETFMYKHPNSIVFWHKLIGSCED